MVVEFTFTRVVMTVWFGCFARELPLIIWIYFQPCWDKIEDHTLLAGAPSLAFFVLHVASALATTLATNTSCRRRKG